MEKILYLPTTRTLVVASLITSKLALADIQPTRELEEVLVTAQKREQSLQQTPIAISVLNTGQLETLGINSLDALGSGAIPSLRIQPFGNTPSTLIMAIRGNGPLDIGQPTREGAVAVYVDGVYMGRSQGLAMEFTDIARMEVLRGPQGTLFGRNAVGGAVNIVSRQPKGELGIKQTLSAGRFNAFSSLTHIDLPEFAGISTKIDYIHTERDGWVNNTAPGEADYNQYEKDSGQLRLHWQATDLLSIDYSYNRADVDAAQNYFQLFIDNIGPIGPELKRQTTTRFPVQPVEPTVTEQTSHALTLDWGISESIHVKSITAARTLDEDTFANYAGVLYANGLLYTEALGQKQFSQEFQFLGSNDRIEWVAGLFYFDEDIASDQQNFFTLDSVGCLSDGQANTPVTATTVFTVCTQVGPLNFPTPPVLVDAKAESLAAYGQMTWIPAVLKDRLALTLGTRYTEDKKSGSRTNTVVNEFDVDTSNTDLSFTLDYKWTEALSTYTLSTYVKWATGYKAGGVSVRSEPFVPYGNENVNTLEVGFKSEFWDRRARLNTAIFFTDYKDMQIDFLHPTKISVVETINAQHTVEVDGVEMDFTAVLAEGLVLNVSYTYLDGDMPLQPNPLAGGVLTDFEVTQTPQHAGALAIDYTFRPWRFSTVTAHLDLTSTDQYAYAPLGAQRFDAYTLLNARLTLADFTLNNNTGTLTVSAWGKNLGDEDYVVLALPIGNPLQTVNQTFGDPRTAGIDIVYEF